MLVKPQFGAKFAWLQEVRALKERDILAVKGFGIE